MVSHAGWIGGLVVRMRKPDDAAVVRSLVRDVSLALARWRQPLHPPSLRNNVHTARQDTMLSVTDYAKFNMFLRTPVKPAELLDTHYS